MKNIFITIIMAFVTVGCASSWDVEALNQMETNGSSFDKALKNEYVKIARAEKDEGDWKDAKYFVEKGKLAAMGETPKPEFADYRDVKPKYDGKVRAARQKLINALAGGANASSPVKMAKAQTGYECWTQELEEGFQPEDIKACWMQFERNIMAIENLEDFTVYFASGSAVVSEKGMMKVKKVAKVFKDKNFAYLYVGGHTDSVGSKAVNKAISEKRADAVMKLLEKYGVASAKIKSHAYGLETPAVMTKMGVPSAKNRRVEIYFE